MNKKLVLASQSPRRKDLLQTAGYNFTIMHLDVDEIYPESLVKSEDIVMYLAELKAKAAPTNENETILTADTIVIKDGAIIGKPQDRDDAIQTLTSLSNRAHTVQTAVSIVGEGYLKTSFETSEVHFGQLSHDEITFYIDTFSPMDKAGSYGIQDWLGLCKVTKIIGSHSNIMGLPMELVYRMLRDVSIYPAGLNL